jgi:1-acyl-sn-glycerol-3-phosphate acyltransferase
MARSLLSFRSLGFPFTAPTTPGTVEARREKSTLGIDYDTTWARRYGVRLARAMVIDNIERPLARFIADPRITGTDRLEGVKGPVIFASNHASHADMPLVVTSVPSRFRHRLVVAAGADYFFDKRWKAHLSAFALNAVPIDRTKISRRSADLPADLLGDGWNLLIFPEGGRSPDGWGHEHRGGAAYLAGRTGAPVVPIHLEGTRRIIKKGASRPSLSSTSVTFGAPMRPQPGESSRSFAARIEAAVARLADEQANGFWEASKRAAAGATPTLRGPEASSWRRTWVLGEGRRRTRKAPAWPKL